MIYFSSGLILSYTFNIYNKFQLIHIAFRTKYLLNIVQYFDFLQHTIPGELNFQLYPRRSNTFSNSSFVSSLSGLTKNLVILRTNFCHGFWIKIKKNYLISSVVHRVYKSKNLNKKAPDLNERHLIGRFILHNRKVLKWIEVDPQIYNMNHYEIEWLI